MESCDAWTTIKKIYKIQKLLGSGSYGEVFKAKNRQTGEIFAIKRIIKIETEHHWRFVAREIEILI
jgi:serine/threonine protein kinase